MIPSRPLDLGSIIGESIRIVRQTYWKATLIALIFLAPGLIILQLGINELLDDSQEVITKYTDVSPDTPILFRDYLFAGKIHLQSSISILRLQYPGLFNAIDSVEYSLKEKYADSSSAAAIKFKLDSITTIVRSKNPLSGPIAGGNFDFGIVLCVIAFIILILGAIGSSAAQYDLSCRSFEERPLTIPQILVLSVKRTSWFLLAQYVVISFAMLFGISVVVGLTFAISPILGALGILAAFILIFYAIFRILFSGIALVSEEMGPVNAIKRSLDLTKGMFMRILGIGLICWIIITIISSFIQLPFSFVFTADIGWLEQYIRGNSVNIPQILHQLRTSIYGVEAVYIIPAILASAFSPAFLTTFYYDLRTRHDGPLEYSQELPGETSEELQIPPVSQ